MTTTVADLNTRWQNLCTQLSETKHKVHVNSQNKRFYTDLGAMTEILESYERWMTTQEKVATESLEISRQLEQCKVKKH